MWLGYLTDEMICLKVELSVGTTTFIGLRIDDTDNVKVFFGKNSGYSNMR